MKPSPEVAQKITPGSAGGWFCTFPNRDRASENDRKIVAGTMPDNKRSARAVYMALGTLGVITWAMLAIILVDRQIAKHRGVAYLDRMLETSTPFEYTHDWRQNHTAHSMTIYWTPSQDAAEEEVACRMLRTGYRLPRWWEVNRWDEDLPEEFRKRIETLQKQTTLPCSGWEQRTGQK